MRQENNKFLRFPHHITRHTYILVFLCLLVVSSYLTLTGLDNAAFWDDEAQTAIFARNLLTHGELTGWDGRNLYTYRNGSLLNDELNIINPPLDILVCALSFRIFGPSTWSGRIFFALMGLLSFVIFALALKLDFHPTRWQWFFRSVPSCFLLSVYSFSTDEVLPPRALLFPRRFLCLSAKRNDRAMGLCTCPCPLIAFPFLHSFSLVCRLSPLAHALLPPLSPAYSDPRSRMEVSGGNLHFCGWHRALCHS